MTPEELLVHSDFLKRLVRSLVGNKDQAEDVLQQTWLTALERQNTQNLPTRTFLSRILRNIVRTVRRGEKSRKARERNYVETKKLLEPEEIASLEESRRHLIESVLKLQDPYRNAILRRYYDDMSPIEIAERFGESVNTIKTRINRGVHMMRKMMDNSQDRSRQDWRIALAPLIGLYLKPDMGEVISMQTSAPQSMVQGAGLTTAKITVAIAVATLCVISAFVPSIKNLFKTGNGVGITVPAFPPDDDSNSSNSENSKDPIVVDGRLPNGKPDMGDREKIEASGCSFSLSVKDKESGQPIEAYRYKFFMEGPGNKLALLKEETVGPFDRRTDFDDHADSISSSFSITKDELYAKAAMLYSGLNKPDIDNASYRVEITTSDHIKCEITRIFLNPLGQINEISAQMDPGLSVEGMIIDALTHEPIAQALIGSGYSSWDYESQLEPEELEKSEEACVHARSNENGYFMLKGMERNCKSIIVDAEGYVQAKAMLPPTGEDQKLNFELERGYRISGIVRDDAGNPTNNVRILIVGDSISIPRYTDTNDEGFYVTQPVAPGEVFISSEALSDPDGNSPQFTQEIRRVVIEDHDVEISFGPDPDRQVCLQGTVTDEYDNPIHGAELILTRSLIGGIPSSLQGRYQIYTCDEMGRFYLPKLELDTYWIKIFNPNLKRFQGPEKFTFSRPGDEFLDLKFKMINPTLSGTVVYEDTGKPFRMNRIADSTMRIYLYSGSGTQIGYSHPIDSEGNFAIYDELESGRYYIFAAVTMSSRMQTRKTIDIIAGRHNKVNIEVPALGKLRVDVIASKGIERDSMVLVIDHDGNYILNRPLKYGPGSSIRQGIFPLPAGLNLVHIYCEDMGMVERQVYIEPREITNLTFKAEDFIRSDHGIPVYGRLCFDDGTPVGNAVIIAKDYFSHTHKIELTASIEPNGYFDFPGVTPGYWEIWAKTSNNELLFIDFIAVSSDRNDALIFDRVLDHNGISGTLPAELNGKSDNDTEIHTYLREFHSWFRYCMLDGYPVNGLFEFAGVPDGLYQLIIRAPGFEEYRSTPFKLKDSRILRLKEIKLEPLLQQGLETER